MKAIIYHNPRCSKSRQTLQILNDNKLETEIVLYKQAGVGKEVLTELLQKLGCKAQEIIRFKDAKTKALGITIKDSKTQEEWIELMQQNPEIIERPIVVVGNRAVMGRPPEKVLELI